MAPLALSAVFVAAAAAAAALVGGVAGIDNGLGITPPQGWRSWNVYPCEDNATIVTQARIEAQFAAAVDKSRSVSGVPTSLAELGFDYVSIDDGWQKCNCSTHQDEDPDLPACGDPGVGPMAWHDAAGVPVVNLARFPDMKGMIDKGHTMGLKVGIYLNNCICAERAPHYEQDAAWLVALGFDEVKVDACGGSGDVGKYAALFNASGRPVRIENCHNQFGPDLATGFCPMNMYRSGGDIGAGFGDILGKLYGSVDFIDRPAPFGTPFVGSGSGPGCWAYPDMCEVGNFAPSDQRFDEERSHWALWAIVSSPLILGFDMNNSETMDRVWPTITNRDILRVNQAWAGFAGTLAKTYSSTASEGFSQVVQGPCDGSAGTLGWALQPTPGWTGLAAPGGQCVSVQNDQGCPPPSLHDPNVQCGFFTADCTLNPQGNWTLNGTNRALQFQGQGVSGQSECPLKRMPARPPTRSAYTTPALSVFPPQPSASRPRP
jgi:alpha-galactosidase